MKRTTDEWSAVDAVSPSAARTLRFLCSRAGVALLLALVVLGLGARALGQSASPTVLSAAQCAGVALRPALFPS